jgi:hypothetical protein
MPLSSSFWVDEMGTVFVVHHGAADPTLRAAPQVADSIYYALPALAEKLFGLSEISYRLFSLLAMAGSLFIIARIASRLFHPHAAWFAVLACLSSRNFNYQAADARPYALGTFILCCAILFLIRWLDSGRPRDALLFAAPAILLWWVHLIFWPFYLLFALYAGVRLLSRQTAAGPVQVLAAFALIAAGILPVAFRALALLHAASSHVIVPPPVLADLSSQLKLTLLSVTCTAALLAGRYLRWPAPQKTVTAASMALVAGWWLIDPVTIFTFSRLTANSVFVPRYMFLAIPGVGLTATLILAMIVPASLWKGCALALGIGILAFGGHWRHLWLPHQNSDWRAAAQTLRQWTAAGSSPDDVPVICPSPFIEAQPPVWQPDYPLSGFLYSHLAVYPMSGHVYRFPYETSAEAESYATSLAQATLSKSPRFAIYGGDRNVKLWQQYFTRQPELKQWQSRVLALYGDVEIVVFVK